MKKAKKLLSIFFCIIMMFAMMPMAVSAEDAAVYTIKLHNPRIAADVVFSPAQVTVGDTVTVTVTPHEGYGLKSVMHSTPQWWGGIVMTDNGDGSYTGSYVFEYGFETIMVGVDKYRSLTIDAPADAEVTLISMVTGEPVTDTAMEMERMELTVSGPAIGYTASINGNAITLTDNSGMFNMPQADATLTITALAEYVYTEGANSTWEEETAGEATFKINADYDKYVAVYVDDALVDPENYTVSEGSTIITFKPEYLATLSEGEHELTVTFTDGMAVTNFTVEAEEEQNNTVYVPVDDYNDNNEDRETAKIPSKGIVVISNKTETEKVEAPAEEENPNTGAI